MTQAPHIMVVEAQTHPEIAESLAERAIAEIAAAECTHERFAVPGLLEVPAAIRFAVRSLDFFATRRRFDGYVALGCLIAPEPPSGPLVLDKALDGLRELILGHTLAVGSGLFAADSADEARRAVRAQGADIGGRAATACLDMVDLKSQFRLFPR